MKRKVSLLSILVISVLLLAACSPSALNSLSNGQFTVPLAQSNTPTPAIPATTGGETSGPVVGNTVPAVGTLGDLQGTLSKVYSQVNPSVVNIQVVESATQQVPGFQFGFGNGNNQNNAPAQQALGSGFVWDSQGHIVTNNHVVDGASTITVTFSDGFTVPAKVVGRDVNSDLAVVQVEAGTDHLKPVTLAQPNSVEVGNLAIAIGNPYGLSGTMTMGIISAIDRSLPVQNNNVTSSGGSYTIPNVIQTDAPINPGNSGGVLLNDQGQVVGVTSAIESTSGTNAGIGFAIPSAIVQKVIPALIQTGSYSYSWLGISGTSLTYDLNQAMKLNSEQRGVLVADVTSGGPAANAGIQGSSQPANINGQSAPVGGDVITAIDNQPVTTFDDMVGYLMMNTQPGQKVTLTILRNGQEQKVQVTLAARPSNTAALTQNQGQNNNNNNNNNSNNNNALPTRGARLGISGIDLNTAINQAAGLNANQQGVLVEQVQPGSPAEQAGLKAGTKTVTVDGQDLLVGGDIITALDGKPVASVQDLQSMLQQYQSGQKATLSLLRNGQEIQVQVTLAGQ